MIIGVPREIKTREYRVGMTAAGAKSLTSRGHKVLVEKGAGEGSGIKDDDYVAAGATRVGSAAEQTAVTRSVESSATKRKRKTKKTRVRVRRGQEGKARGEG